jgi:dihydroorotate dehydrogenase
VAAANIRSFRSRRKPEDFPIGVSIMGHPLQEGAERLRGVLRCLRTALPLADFIELNVSCPNVGRRDEGEGGVARAPEDSELRQTIRAVVTVRDATARDDGRRVPLLLKLAEVGHAEETVRALVELGVDGIVLLNSQHDHAALPTGEDAALVRCYGEQYDGGLSGRPIAARAARLAAGVTAAAHA